MSRTDIDKPFVRRVAADLAALGAYVWIDEAELTIGDSLLGKTAAEFWRSKSKQGAPKN